jgi:hypothetical protein
MAAGLAAASEDDGAAGVDPFINLARRHSKKVGDGSVKEIAVGCKYFGGVLVDLGKVSFELCEAFRALSLFFCSVALAVTESPKVVAFNEEWVQDFSVPDVGFVLRVRELTEAVIMLEERPGGDDTATEQVSPAHGGLVNGELFVGVRVGREFTSRQGCGVKVGAEAREKDVYKFRIGVAGFGTSPG